MNQIGVLVVLLLLAYILLAPSGEIAQHTVYEVYCPDFDSNVYDCPESLDTLKMTYLAIPETQTIISKGNLLWKYEDCVVFDAENWRCDTNKHDAKEYDQVMRNGSYTDLSDSIKKPKRRTALQIEYVIRNILQFFASF